MSHTRIWQSAVARILSKRFDQLSPNDVVARFAQDLRKSGTQAKKLNLEVISSGLGLSVVYQPLSVDALLKETDGGYVAMVNSLTNKVRQRFSLAHELGHLILFNSTGLTQAFGHIASPDQNTDANEMEDLCDLFATELLMPIDDWKKELFSKGISLKVLARLMSRYGVSLPAAARRVIESNVWRCSIISWEPVYVENTLVEVKRVGCWENTGSRSCSWPKTLENKIDLQVPGLPFCALKTGQESNGKIFLPNSKSKARFLAQSDILRGKTPRVATVAIPEHYGWDIILRSASNS